MNNLVKVCVIVIAILLNSACQSTSHIYQPHNQFNSAQLYADDLFNDYQYKYVESKAEIFSLSEEMAQLVNANIKSHKSTKQQVHDLVALIFDEQQIGLAYRNSANLTAVNTFKNREANCISLTILAYALAKEANLTVQFQDVIVPEYWIRNGKYSLLAGHVNIAIFENRMINIESIFNPQKIVIDFDPHVRKKEFPVKPINQNTVTAMFYTNKGAQAMVDKAYVQAYAYFKAATQVAPDYSPAWGNLGLLYKLNQQVDLAINAYEHAISLEPDNLTTINNLAILFKQTGQLNNAEMISDKLHQLRIKNPFYHALLADTAYYNENIDDAIAHYKTAIKLDNSQHEFHYGLAQMYLINGDNLLAQRSLKIAIKLNKYPDIDNQYFAKLNFLRETYQNH